MLNVTKPIFVRYHDQNKHYPDYSFLRPIIAAHTKPSITVIQPNLKY